MRKLAVFNNVTLDGFFSGPKGDISWAKGHMDPEFHAFTVENATGGGVLLLGRKTYELMIQFWPTPMARQMDPVIADRMNNGLKIVFSKTLTSPTWSNTRVAGNLLEHVRKMKSEPGDPMVILGSGSIVAQLAQENLIDEYQVVLNPYILGQGRTMFEGVTKTLPLKLTNSRSFTNGNVFLRYEPA